MNVSCLYSHIKRFITLYYQQLMEMVEDFSQNWIQRDSTWRVQNVLPWLFEWFKVAG